MSQIKRSTKYLAIALISAKKLQLLLAGEIAGSMLPPIVVDSRPEHEYEAGHIPTAVPIGWEDWNAKPMRQGVGFSLALWEPGYWGALDNKRLDEFVGRLAKLGLSNHRPVVVYADALASKGREGRIAWMLLYLGVENVFLLDGGWRAWLDAGGACDRQESRVERGNFTLRIDGRRRVSTDCLARMCSLGRMPTSVDTRSLSEFQGDSFDYQPRTGHLPEAVQLSYESLFEDSGVFVGREKFLSLLDPWVLADSNLITYCEVGVRASMYALLLEVYTGRVLPVYDGSIMEWGADKALPLFKV
ncbi:sulfurtransferase [bacterium]|nr:sulfurtransferase [bacterium]MBP9807465.1 sulfurtransferase [bacterium]